MLTCSMAWKHYFILKLSYEFVEFPLEKLCVSSGDYEWIWVARCGDQSPTFGSCLFLLIVVSRMELELSVFHKVLLMS